MTAPTPKEIEYEERDPRYFVQPRGARVTHIRREDPGDSYGRTIRALAYGGYATYCGRDPRGGERIDPDVALAGRVCSACQRGYYNDEEAD